MSFQSGVDHVVIKYSPRAAKAIGQLKSHYNDIEVFVEDTGNHNMWLLVLRSIMPKGVKLESVTMLGGRNAVIKACELDQENDSRRKLYIIDGDMDFLLGKRAPGLKHLHRIRAANIENLILHEDALVSMALEHEVKKSDRTIRADLNFAEKYSALEKCLRPLFVAYAVVQKLRAEISTTSFSVHKLLTHKKSGAELDLAKVRKRIFSLYRHLASFLEISKIRVAKDAISARANKLPLAQIASGKDYILPLIMIDFQSYCGYGKGAENFKVALSRSYSKEIEPFFSRKVASLFV